MTGTADIAVERVYDPQEPAGRARLLVDRIWPRGLTKARVAADDWIPEVAPSHALRRWFGHDPALWDEFRNRYQAELESSPEAVARCLEWCRKGPVTLLYGARDRERNQAVVLRAYLTGKLERE